MHRWIPSVILVVLSLTCSARALAQTIRGNVLGASSARPASAAFIILEDSAGVQRAGALTDTLGRYALRAPRPGVYRLRVERLALETHRTDWFGVEVGDVVRDIHVPERAIALSGLTAAAERRGCRARGELAADAAQLFEEARKSLAVIAWVSQTQRMRLLIQRSLRERRAGAKQVLLEVDDGAVREVRGTPWNSAPASELLTRGFVRAESGGYVYYGPDAALLLSDEFVASHCFTVVAHQTAAELIGLAFRPAERPRVTDISGVLWLQRSTFELHSIDYSYEALPYRVDDSVGGTVSFRRLPTGIWIVAGWVIRAPRPADAMRGLRPTDVVMSEHSARVIGALDAQGAPLLPLDSAAMHTSGAVADMPFPGGAVPARFWAAQRCGAVPTAGHAHAVGRVLDTRGQPLPGARVNILAAHGEALLQYYDTTDPDGRYRICDFLSDRVLRLEAELEGYRKAETPELHFAGDLLRRDFVLNEAAVRQRR